MSSPRPVINHATVQQRSDGLLYPDGELTSIPVQCCGSNTKDSSQNCYGQARHRCAFKKGKKSQCDYYLCNIHALDSLDGRKDMKFCEKHVKFSDPKQGGCTVQ